MAHVNLVAQVTPFYGNEMVLFGFNGGGLSGWYQCFPAICNTDLIVGLLRDIDVVVWTFTFRGWKCRTIWPVAFPCGRIPYKVVAAGWTITRWALDYYSESPGFHWSIGYKTPSEYGTTAVRVTADTNRIPEIHQQSN